MGAGVGAILGFANFGLGIVGVGLGATSIGLSAEA